VAVESIGATIEIRDVAGDHLLVAAREMSLGEMDGVGEIDDLAQEVRARAKTLDDARDSLPAGACAPIIVGGERFARGFRVFGDSDFRRGWYGCRGCRKFGLVVLVIACHACLITPQNAAHPFL
jgi:hypothetical protein